MAREAAASDAGAGVRPLHRLHPPEHDRIAGCGIARTCDRAARGTPGCIAVGTERRVIDTIDVYPHAATIGLFGLERIVKYEKGTAEQRR